MTYSSYLTYPTYLATIANLMVVPPTDPNFLQIVPAMIADSEQRMYRELQLLNTIVRDTGGNLAANSRNFTLPQTYGTFITTTNMNVFSPSGSQTNRNQLVPVTRDWMDAVWPNEAATTSPSLPQYYAMITDQIIIVGPPPDAAYTMEAIGTIRPTPLSASNPSTFLTYVLPDAFIAASMIFASSYQLNFSAASDDPQQAQTWKSHYDALIASANIEENQKKYASQAWTSAAPAPIATPPRV